MTLPFRKRNKKSKGRRRVKTRGEKVKGEVSKLSLQGFSKWFSHARLNKRGW